MNKRRCSGKRRKVVYKMVQHTACASFHGLFTHAFREALKLAQKEELIVASIQLNNFSFDEDEMGQFLFRIELEKAKDE